ncbi:MAG: hypothetical protein KTV77_01705 [Wolbachia endosymbiont of Fragariocoptes setiger]|nr:hypothetical protein [Wolbachia endosymbiont of Fragariocoptes setiger]
MKKYIDLGANVNYLSPDNNMSIIEALLNTQFKHIIENNTSLQSNIDQKNSNSERLNIENLMKIPV